MSLELFDVSRRWPRQRTQSDDEVSFVNSGILFTAFCSIRRPYITFKLPRGDMDTPPRLRNFFRCLPIGMCHFRYLWNGLCDRHRAEITVMQFTGHSLPVHRSEVGPYYQPSTPARFLSIISHCDVSLPLSSEWQVWSSSSGNNYHAVHRSLSSCASLFFTAQWEFLPCLILWAKLYFTHVRVHCLENPHKRSWLISGDRSERNRMRERKREREQKRERERKKERERERERLRKRVSKSERDRVRVREIPNKRGQMVYSRTKTWDYLLKLMSVISFTYFIGFS